MPFSEKADVLRKSRESRFLPMHSSGNGNPATALLPIEAHSHDSDVTGNLHPSATGNVGPINALVRPRACSGLDVECLM